jgi:hypothetical protein
MKRTEKLALWIEMSRSQGNVHSVEQCDHKPSLCLHFSISILLHR